MHLYARTCKQQSSDRWWSNHRLQGLRLPQRCRCRFYVLVVTTRTLALMGTAFLVRVEEQTANTDPKANFRLIIIQTELERFKFLVRSFLRARIAIIDAHALRSSL